MCPCIRFQACTYYVFAQADLHHFKPIGVLPVAVAGVAYGHCRCLQVSSTIQYSSSTQFDDYTLQQLIDLAYAHPYREDPRMRESVVITGLPGRWHSFAAWLHMHETDGLQSSTRVSVFWRELIEQNVGAQQRDDRSVWVCWPRVEGAAECGSGSADEPEQLSRVETLRSQAVSWDDRSPAQAAKRRCR